LEILERLGPSNNSLGEYLALLGQPILLDYAKDRDNVCKVFLVVPPGVNRDTDIRSAKRDDNDGASNIVLPCPGS
jgi:hypothetical protein